MTRNRPEERTPAATNPVGPDPSEHADFGLSLDERLAGPRGKTADQKQKDEWEALARQLIADGYTSSVVVRKMITQFDMPEPDAEALVGGLVGKKVSARTGGTLYKLWGGFLLVGVGSLYPLLIYAWGPPSPSAYARGAGGYAIGLICIGTGQIFYAIVNRGVKEDLRDPRRLRTEREL